MTEQELFQKVRSIVMLASGVSECILADQNRTAPTACYAAIRATSGAETIGAPERCYLSAPDRKVEQQIKKLYRVTFDVNFYRKGALDAARRLSSASFRSDVFSHCIREKIELVDIGAVSNLSSLVSASIEERANMKIVVTFKHTEAVIINNIERVPLLVQDEKARTIIEFTVKEE